METIAAEAAQQARSGIHAELEALRVEVRLANEGLDTKLEGLGEPLGEVSRRVLEVEGDAAWDRNGIKTDIENVKRDMKSLAEEYSKVS